MTYKKNWNTLSEFFETLNKTNVRYVVLRKYEKLPYSFTDDDKDIDILCDNKDKIIETLGLEKRSVGISGYMARVGKEQIPIDIRYKGDCYYDNSWEEIILQNRIMVNGIYVPDNNNQIMTVLYHVITQKKKPSQYYRRYFKEHGITIGDGALDVLGNYMNDNNYYYFRPVDMSVYQNRANIKRLKDKLGQCGKIKLSYYNIISKLPDKFIFGRVKEYYKNKKTLS